MTDQINRHAAKAKTMDNCVCPQNRDATTSRFQKQLNMVRTACMGENTGITEWGNARTKEQ